VAAPFAGFEVKEELRPVAQLFDFDLDARLASVVALEAHVPQSANSARNLGTLRQGNAIMIGEEGLLLTISYLLTEAEQVILTTNDGFRAEGYVLGVDQATGLGLVHALEPLGLPAAPLGDSRQVRGEGAVVSVGGGGREHASCGRIFAREPFAGDWEYMLEEALFVEPAHPHWSGAGLFGPTGDLIGVGSLYMEQEAEGGGVTSLNMFVPAELLAPIREDLSHGRQRPPRPWLGVRSQEIQRHVVITNVSPGGPASRAELRRGDIVHRVAGNRVNSLASFYKQLWALGPPGSIAPLTIQREHDVFDVEVRTMDRSALQRRRRLN
jgi:S1-C subfamily serine protease